MGEIDVGEKLDNYALTELLARSEMASIFTRSGTPAPVTERQE